MDNDHILVVNMSHVLGSSGIAQRLDHTISVVIEHVLVPRHGPFSLHAKVKDP